MVQSHALPVHRFVSDALLWIGWKQTHSRHYKKLAQFEAACDVIESEHTVRRHSRRRRLDALELAR